jgi:putative ABC transport system permease protein
MSQRGNITYVRALSIIAIFILLIACFNFINLATAKSLQRAKEVGVRKTIGAGRRQLVFQFISETILLSFISMMIAVCLGFILLPWLNNLQINTFHLRCLPTRLYYCYSSLLLFLVGVVAGIYPAMVLSGFKPVKVLKANYANEQPGKIPWLRHSLVIVQFALSALFNYQCCCCFQANRLPA